MNIIKKIFFILIITGSIIQTFGFFFFGLSSITIITSQLFIWLLYLIISKSTILLFKLISFDSKNKSNILLLINSIFITLSCAELFLRLLGTNATYFEKTVYHYESPYKIYEVGWFHIWKYNHYLVSSEYKYDRKINNENLSDIEHPIEKAFGEFRIIGIGDSFTEGDGAHKDSTWLKALEKNMQKYQLKCKISFINAGVCGSDPFFEYILLKEKLLKYKPDLVLISINNSDIDDVIIRGGMERFLPDGTLKFNNAPCWEPIFAVSYISRLFFSKVLKYNQFLIKKNSYKYQLARKKIFQCLIHFQKLSLENNFKIVIIFHPFNFEIVTNKLTLSDVLNKIKNNTQIECFDMFEYLTNKENINNLTLSKYYWQHNGHHNNKGYEAFARGVEWKLKEMNLIDSLSKK